MTDKEIAEPLIKTIHIKAAPEVVFGFFTEPEKLTRWICSEATTDPRPGGAMSQKHVAGPDGPLDFYLLEGEFIEVDHPRRVVFTWRWGNNPDPEAVESTDTIAVDLVAAGDGTDLTLTHTGHTTAASKSENSGGWDIHLGKLAGLFE